MILSVRDIALWLFFAAFLLIYYTSLTPWFLWNIYSYASFLAFFPIVLSYLISRHLQEPIFTRTNYVFPLLCYFLYIIISGILSGKNINGFIGDFFNFVAVLFLFRINTEDLVKFGNVLSISMGALLLPSLFFYALYLLGFSLPNYYIDNPLAEYSYENYYFFLVNLNEAWTIIPRFQSVFVEPSHLAMACIVLLLTQVGNWKKWYNVTMFVAIFISFSLAGYLFLIIVLFASAWMKGRNIWNKLLALVGFSFLIGISAIFYNDGDNLVNQLIVQRLVVNDDGKLEGDNRVTTEFETAYNDFVKSDKLLFGEGTEKLEQFGWGNAGYRVYIYVYGLISLVFLLFFLLAISITGTSKRGIFVMLLIHAISFIPHAITLKFYFFTPLYIIAFRRVFKKNEEEETPMLD
ncbi:MAG: hypothetical protein IKO73_05270 [Bacteroidaceae bacterium]|nr:hypothetical protein [Bacteroidaceae bacterium]